MCPNAAPQNADRCLRILNIAVRSPQFFEAVDIYRSAKTTLVAAGDEESALQVTRCISDSELKLKAYEEAVQHQSDAKTASDGGFFKKSEGLFLKAVEKFTFCGATDVASVCDGKACELNAMLESLLKAKVLETEAGEKMEIGISQGETESLEEGIVLLEEASSIYISIKEEEAAMRVQRFSVESQRRLSSMTEAIRKAQEGEEAAQEGKFEKASISFSGSKIDFESAGCLEYARMAENKRHVAQADPNRS